MTALETFIFRPKPCRIWDPQEAENELNVTWEPLIHRFLDFTLFAFWAVQEEEN